MSKKKKRQRARVDPATASNKGYYIRSVSNEDICFSGYHPLSKNEEVLKCVHRIASLVSNMTVMLMENGENGDKRIYNGLSRKLDVEPNPMQNRKSFLYRIVMDMALYGNSIAIPIAKDGLLESINLIPFGKYSWWQDNNNINHYGILYNGKKYEGGEILNFVYSPDSYYPYRGNGFTEMIQGTVETLLQANTTKDSFLKSKWKPSLVISVNADSEELQDADTKDNIIDSYVSTSEEGKPWLIPADEVKIDTIKPLTLNDLAIQDSITLDKKSIASAIGVPTFMVGVGDFKKDEYNNFIATVIADFGQIIQQEITRKCILSPSLYVKLNARSLMQYDLAEMSAHVKEMVGGGMFSRNEGRTSFDYSPSDAEGMNDYIVLENYIPVSKVGEQKKLQSGGDAKNEK